MVSLFDSAAVQAATAALEHPSFSFALTLPDCSPPGVHMWQQMRDRQNQAAGTGSIRIQGAW